MKVTVVVPVWNPGTYLDRCVDSFIGQSLPADEFEVVFVDDGSTDDAPRRLDDLAAAHPTFRVIHIPNSGWPGRPRNLGVEAARGEYVQFVDQDDHLAPEALERLHAMGARNDADIVIGRVTSDFRGVPTSLFRRDREACTVLDAPLIYSLTPHKMFRRAFLQEHAIAFPEGKRRLEDQLYMVRAYFRARVVSVLSSYPCYFYMRRADDGNAGTVRIDPPGYYANLREVLDVVEAETSPGTDRDRFLQRFYRVEMLERLSGDWYASQEPAYQALLFRSIRDVAIERMDEGVAAGLSSLGRTRDRLLRADDPGAMLELARRTSHVGASARLHALDWVGGRLKMAFHGAFEGDPDAVPLDLVRREDRLLLDPGLTDGLGLDPVDASDDLAKSNGTVSLRDRATGVDWEVRASSAVRLEPTAAGGSGDESRLRPVIDVMATVNPLEAAGGRPLEPGTWDVRIRLSAFGLDRRVGLSIGDPAREHVPLMPALLGDPSRLVVPRSGDDGLTLDVGGIEQLHGALVGRPVVARPGGGRSIAIGLAVAADARTGHVPAQLLLENDRGARRWPATLVGRDDQLTATARFGILRGRLPHGSYRLSLELDDGESSLPVGALRAGLDGRVYVDGGQRIRLVSSGIASVRRWIRAVARRLPAPVKERLRRVARATG